MVAASVASQAVSSSISRWADCSHFCTSHNAIAPHVMRLSLIWFGYAHHTFEIHFIFAFSVQIREIQACEKDE